METNMPLRHARSAGLSNLLPPLLLGHLRYRPLEFLAQASERGELTRLGWAGNPLYYAATPELVNQLLFDPRRFVKGSLLKKLEIIIGKGLITLNGDAWKDARRRVQKVFHRDALHRQHETIIRHTLRMIDRLKDRPGPVSLDRVMNELTFNIALELFLGADADTVDDMDGLQDAVDNLNAYAKWRTWSFIPPHWKTRRNEQFRESMGLLDAVVEKVLRQRQRATAAERETRVDVLSQLLDAGFEGQALRDHVMTMLIAGHETTGTTLSFLWAHVARRSDIQEALYSEAQALGSEAVDLERLPLTDAVWKETLRLYPAVPILDRMAVEDTQLGGYRIPAGANVLWSPYVLQRSARYWPHRRDPNAFEPAAFLHDPPPMAGTYIPFGTGPRMCMGKALADMEALTIVSLLVRAFRIESVETGEVGMRTLVTLRPAGGVPARLTPRLPAARGKAPSGCPIHRPAPTSIPLADAPAIPSACPMSGLR